MTLAGLLGALDRDTSAAQWLRAARDGLPGTDGIAAPPGAFAALAALVAHPDFADRPVLLVTPTIRAADDLAAELGDFLPSQLVATFPAWETLPHERMSPSPDIVGQRTSVLRRLAHPEGTADRGPLRTVVAPVRAALQPVAAGLGDVPPVVLAVGDEVPLDVAVRRLVASGYTRTELVERRGEFAVRGGILDVFPPTSPHPVRVEFFGDEVDDVRLFAVADQRSLGPAPEGLWAPVCREVLLDDAARARASAAAQRYPALADLLGPMADGVAVEGMEAVAPLVVPGMTTLVDLLPDGAVVVVVEPELVATRALEMSATSGEFLAAGWDVAAQGSAAPPVELADSAYRTLPELRRRAHDLGVAWLQLKAFAGDSDDLALDAQSPPAYRGDIEVAAADFSTRLGEGDRVVVVAAGPGSARRMQERFGEFDVPARTVADVGADGADPVVEVVPGELRTGFIAEGAGLVVISEADIFGSSALSAAAPTRMPARRRKAVDPLTLSPGDYVVHEQHGVGRYVEMVQRTVGGAEREYLVVEYAPSRRGQPPDRLFVPMDQLGQVTRYVGGEAPAVNRLGGADWQKSKGRARKAVGQIVDGLVKLYAARQRTKGRSFGPDTPWQRELEDAFPYAETPDQLECIDEVKADMAKPIPMDRVICGDVGFGKTEIAVRAAFKAVADGTQVIVLVPTTLLARQHLQTFRERFAPFPVRVEGLSRFTPDSEAKATLAGLADGTVDVVVATHRILGPGTAVKDLGLVIVDEEQRFGVEHKEHLKALRTNVDVLTMSATPIPRTLEMAVTGIREMSTIATPPEERLPVLTFVGAYHDRQVAAAIRRELARDGQVFFLHNRVESIDRVAKRLQDLVPEASIAVAHGQMREGQLEQVMVDFWERRANVLVCTTIVESGLDIPNANTLIVDRADAFGLAQLHQLRGRVGRGRERAYAYFLYDGNKPLSEAAYERLSTIAARTELGSGMAVAMKDLEIRGAGNLLGDEQAGHIAAIGFDLYVRLVGEALAQVKGEDASQAPTTRIDLPLDAQIPVSYIRDERLRLAAYRSFAETTTREGVDEVLAELTDRYGRPPEQVTALGDVAVLRQQFAAAGVTEVATMRDRIRFEGMALPDSRQVRLDRLYPGCVIKPAGRTVLVPFPATARVGGIPLRGSQLVAWLGEFAAALAGPPATGG